MRTATLIEETTGSLSQSNYLKEKNKRHMNRKERRKRGRKEGREEGRKEGRKGRNEGQITPVCRRCDTYFNKKPEDSIKNKLLELK
jgi:predicted transposase YdaD